MNCIAKAHCAQDLMRHVEKHSSITDDHYGGSISVTYPTFWTPCIQHQNDHLLIDIFLSQVNNPDILCKLNACRLILQVCSIANITFLDARFILPNIHVGINHRLSKLCWPLQKVSRTWWKVWSLHLTSFITPLLHSKPLGTWISSPNQTWQWHLHDLCLSVPNNTLYSPSPTSSRSLHYIPTTSLLNKTVLLRN